MPTYPRADVEFVRGEGARLWDADGKRVPRLLRRPLGPQRRPLPPPDRRRDRRAGRRPSPARRTCSSSEPALRLAERLSESSLGGKVFLCNSGTEAAECAIKLARKHARGRGDVYPEIVSLDGGFHGRTLGALAATPRLADDDRFGPLPRGFTAVARDDADALREAVRSRDRRRPHRADPGRGRDLPDRRRGAGRRARGVRRDRRAPDLRRGPDRNGPDRQPRGPTSSFPCGPT